MGQLIATPLQEFRSIADLSANEEAEQASSSRESSGDLCDLRVRRILSIVFALDSDPWDPLMAFAKPAEEPSRGHIQIANVDSLRVARYGRFQLRVDERRLE